VDSGDVGEAPEATDAEAETSAAAPADAARECPFAGTVRLRHEVELAGHHFGAGTEVFEIGSDWRVGIPGDSSWGWIDVRGAIHRSNLPAQHVDPEELDFGSVVAELKLADQCWAGGVHVGDRV
jgi:hypothetical protein